MFRILIVEDDRVISGMMKKHLESTSKSKGLTIKSSPPIFMAITIFILSPADEMKITGTWENFRISVLCGRQHSDSEYEPAAQAA